MFSSVSIYLILGSNKVFNGILGSLPNILHKLTYGLNTAMFESRQELPELTTGNDARGVLMGASCNGTGHRIPCDKFSHQRSLWALLKDISAR